MKKIVFGILMVILGSLGNLVAQVQVNSAATSVNVFPAPSVAGKSNNFAQDEGDLQRCRVSDMTGTRLNIRDLPNGKIIGKLTNGTVVYTENDMYDTKLRNWSEIKLTQRGKAKGWVASEFLDCE